MTKYIYLFYILLGVCMLAGFGSAFDSGQEHVVVRTVGLENSAVALCNISESNNGQEKKEINNESYHFYKVGIGGAATSFSFRTLCSSKILRTHSSASVIAKNKSTTAERDISTSSQNCSRFCTSILNVPSEFLVI